MTKQLIVKKNRGSIAMMLFLLLTATITVAQSTSSAQSSGAVPQLVKFGGVLKDDAGRIKTGMVGLTFAVYKEEDGGTPLWLETQNVEVDTEGKYSVLLGSTKTEGIPAELFSSNEPRWLGVQIEGQAEQPRILFVSVPYALRARDAETLGGKPLSAFQLVTPQSSNDSGAKQQNATPAAEQPNEIACASGTACKSAFIPLFTTNGGSAKVSDSIITQAGSTVNVSGEVVGKTGFFRSGNSGTIFQATQTNNGGGVGVAGVAEGTSGVGVQGSGFLGVVGQGLGDGATAVVGQAFGSGTGVHGSSSATSGVNRGVEGDVASTSDGSVAVFGEAQGSTGRTVGVEGFNFANTNFASGVSGFADGDQNKTFGVTGQSFSPVGTGLWGLGQGQSATGGLVGCCSVGAWGDTSSNAPFAAGVVGTADDAQGVVALNNSTNNAHPTLKVINFENTAHNVTVLTASGSFGSCISDTDGNLSCTGNIRGNVALPSQRQVALYAMQSPQNWFEDFGSGQLASGTATIHLEPTFAQTVNTGSDYHVFLTPEGDCRGLYVSRKTASGFEVREIGGGRSTVAFDYRIVALRRGFESVRLEDVTDRWNKMNTPVPAPESGPGFKTPSVPPAPVVHSQLNDSGGTQLKAER